jgi:23S rRNA G2069 N7-methylase RlmK/C1962 C5-methylase RlmI
MVDQLFSSVSLREKINGFIDEYLFSNQTKDDDLTSNDYVFIRCFPGFNQKTIDKYSDMIQISFDSTLDQCKQQ